MLIAIKEETSIRFAWEDWNEKYSKSRKRTSGVCRGPGESAAMTRRLSSTAQKVDALDSGPRSPGQENRGRSGDRHTRSVQMRAGSLKAATTSKSTSSRPPAAKSVQSRGTQLDSTPIPFGAGVRSPRAHLTPVVEQRPNILRQMEETPLESTSLAWNHFSSPVVRQTSNPRQLDTALVESSGIGVDLTMSMRVWYEQASVGLVHYKQGTWPMSLIIT